MKARSIDARGTSPQHVAGVSHVNTHVAEPLGLDGRQNFDDAVLVGLAADQRHLGMLTCLPKQMLAAAKPDLEPSRGRALSDEGRIERDTRKNVAQQSGLARSSAFCRAVARMT